MEQDETDWFSISFPRHCVFGHILLDTNPLDDVDSWKEIVQLSKKPRSIDPHRSNPIQIARKTTSNKKLQQKNKKARSVTLQLHGVHSKKIKGSKSGDTPDDIKLKNEHTSNDPISKISNI